MIEFRKIYDRLTEEIRTAKDGKTAITILPTEHAEQVLEMVKRQEPMLVQKIIFQTKDCKVGLCPSCREKIGSLWNKKACGYCGQAVKWNEDDDA